MEVVATATLGRTQLATVQIATGDTGTGVSEIVAAVKMSTSGTPYTDVVTFWKQEILYQKQIMGKNKHYKIRLTN